MPLVKLIYSKDSLSFLSHQETVTSQSHQFQADFIFTWLSLRSEKSKEGVMLVLAGKEMGTGDDVSASSFSSIFFPLVCSLLFSKHCFLCLPLTMPGCQGWDSLQTWHSWLCLMTKLSLSLCFFWGENPVGSKDAKEAVSIPGDALPAAQCLLHRGAPVAITTFAQRFCTSSGAKHHNSGCVHGMSCNVTV